ncbi:uncharacterized protein LOC112563634 isoform X2 [Pomacea canaliculata]|uniref:uncharacterized protein LOC112563634 isoform X2 n=1 Tax=Pomacea canaliculata TaxID=400727 RepID=UPI000D72AE82|nr:uncharacterized protein LOC112563634 isoform X2 [Pomacea canaliculata]
MIKKVWKTFAGIEEVPAIIGSVTIYFLIFMTCLSLQRLSKKLLPKSLYVFAADFFITLAICSYPYGHGTTRQLYGHTGYLVAAVPLVMLTLQYFDGCASPLGVFIKFLKGEETAGKFAKRVVVQIMAAFLSWWLVLLVCLMETTSHHKQLLRRTMCATDLKVSVTMGFVIEFAGVLFDVWLSAFRLFENSFLDRGIKVLNSCLLVCGVERDKASRSLSSVI